MSQDTRAKFITFEGGEGTGKSTQIQALSSYLTQAGIKHIVTREPGGTPLAESIRKLLVQGHADKMDALSEYLLFSAARRDHVEKLIKPALQNQTWVLCDRFYDSSMVYQGKCQGLDAPLMEQVYQAICGPGFTPDLTFIFDLDPQEGLKRTELRTTKSPNQAHEGRFEAKGLPFHQTIRQGFLEIYYQHQNRCVLIDAAQSPEAVFQVLQSKLQPWVAHG
jgi:thymidylate kinase